MKNPFFTVIIPTHNRAELLKGAIQSVLRQSFSNFEIIVIDDHSSDNTKETVDQFKNHQIRYVINTRSMGGSGARNTGIFQAAGKWITFLDDDDAWLEDKLEHFYHVICNLDESYGLVYSGFANYDFENQKEKRIFIPEKEGWILNDLLCRNHIGSYTNIAVRADLIKALGGLDERFKAMQDMELYVRLAHQNRVKAIKKKLSHIRVLNSDRISNKKKIKLESSLLFWEKYKDLIDKNYKVKHRNSARIFLLASIQENNEIMRRMIPGIMLGIIVDLPGFIQIIAKTCYIYIRRLFKT